MLSGLFQKRRGVRSGLPDVLVVYRHATGIIVIFIELKSRRGLASKAQKQLRLEMLPSGAEWRMARSARAAMMALHLSGVVFRRKWEPPQLQPCEGPFADPTQRLPQHPKLAAERREAKRRYRLRKEMRERGRAAQRRRVHVASTTGAESYAVTATAVPMGKNEFRVCQFFPDGSYEYVRRWVSAREAAQTAKHYVNSVAAKLGIVTKVVITDGGDYTNSLWSTDEESSIRGVELTGNFIHRRRLCRLSDMARERIGT